jgi:glutathione S-transferase
MAPVKVFGSAAFTNVARVLVCLEEVGAEYEVVDIDFLTKEQKKPEHLARNVRHKFVFDDLANFLKLFLQP